MLEEVGWRSDIDPPPVANDSNTFIAKGFQNRQSKLFQLFNNVPWLSWVRPFQSIPELVRALEEFRALYNQHWLIEPLGFQPPVRARQRLALQPAA